MQVILDSSFARPGSGPIWGGKKGEFRDWTSRSYEGTKLNLTDIYRELHPKSKSFTYASKSLNLKSRIDYFLILRSLSCDVKQAEIRISIAPDHNAIFLSIDVKNDFNRGPGLWKFNNTLLEDNNYKELIVLYYQQIL